MRGPVRASAVMLVVAVAVGLAGQADSQPRQPGTLRIATFNIFELSCAKIDAVDAQGQTGAHPQVRKGAEILRRVQPDLVLVNEIDYSAEPDCARRFAERYLTNARDLLAPLALPHRVYLPVNTGVPSGLDLTNNGATTDPGDAFGFGNYPGQYGMALFSRYPIDAGAVRTFQQFLWKDMPGHVMPDGESGRPAYYSPEEVTQFRLSSKSHWDVPVEVGGRVIHLLTSHPTPPLFDGPEDSNGRRNFDEIRLWADYITGGAQAGYLTDDQGRRGGLGAGSSFVVIGDLNAEPLTDARRLRADRHRAAARPPARAGSEAARRRRVANGADRPPYPGDPAHPHDQVRAPRLRAAEPRPRGGRHRRVASARGRSAPPAGDSHPTPPAITRWCGSI